MEFTAGRAGSESSRVAFSVVDYRSRQVILREDTWQHHILFETTLGKPHHQEMEGHLEDIKYIIQDPEVVVRDPSYPTREQMYGLVVSEALDRIKPLRVVVDHGPSPAEVVTAHIISKMPRLASTGGVIYVRRRDRR